MTRKCILCGENNYKTTCSFFSAPKDPEVRKKWQSALDIENYVVTDDTYVCSRHFHENDIVTHWVSGVPPHVITIKYKKCRLRPGAVPDTDLYRIMKSFSDSENEQVDRYIDDYEVSIDDYKRELESLENSNNLINSKNSDDALVTKLEKETVTLDKNPCEVISIKDDTISNRKKVKKTHRYMRYETITTEDTQDSSPIYEDITIKTVGDLLNEGESLDSSHHNSVDLASSFTDEIDMKREAILFGDLLEICADMRLPNNWTCTIMRKDKITTIIYMYININRNRIPFVEKQISLENDMTFHCVVLNKEIDPVVHNLFKGDEPLKIQTLGDMEQLIEEFHERHICQGISIHECRRNINMEMIYTDAIGRRHVLCPLIVNNGSSRCTKCILASSKIPRIQYCFSNYGVSVLKKGRKKRILYQKTRECDRRYEIIRSIQT